MQKGKLILALVLSLLLCTGVVFAQQPVTPKSGVNPLPPDVKNPKLKKYQRLIPNPDIRTNLRWEFVRYSDRWTATVRLVATFTNSGGPLFRCPGSSCSAFLRVLDVSTGTPRVDRVLDQRRFDSLGRGQAITITKQVQIQCGREFPPVFEAGADINCDPGIHICHDPDYIVPKEFDSNYSNNYKQLKYEDIENALFDNSCRHRR